jgi:hypothetical protein
MKLHCSKLTREKLRSGLVAIRRFLKSVEEIDLDDKIIDLTISIESLFGDGEKAYSVPLKVSYMVGNNYQQRKLIFEFIQGIYYLRNKIVHGGSGQVFEFNGKKLGLKDVYLSYERITRSCIQKFLNLANNYDSREQINELIDNCIQASNIGELTKKSNGVFTNHESTKFDHMWQNVNVTAD